jgi:hypothetical protein
VKIQFTLTVPEGKRLIARAVVSLPEVERAKREGIIMLKGGTTVSAVAEALCGEKLRISGRISPRGTVCAGNADAPGIHTLILNRGKPEPGTDRMAEFAREMGPGDVAVCSVNIFDPEGRGAIMAGKDLGGEMGAVYPALEAEGVRCIIPAGLEKLSPFPLSAASGAAGRKASRWSMGMAVGLIMVPGEIITEYEALSILGYEKRWLIGRGGIRGAEGSSTFLVEGEREALNRLIVLIGAIKGAGESGTEESLPECLHCGPNRLYHRACSLGGKINLLEEE